jgi:hypothetical protein
MRTSSALETQATRQFLATEESRSRDRKMLGRAKVELNY